VRRILDRLLPLEIEVGGNKISFFNSAGWTDYQIGEEPAELFRRADNVLYVPKESRKNDLQAVS
jgi:hypothetical protein